MPLPSESESYNHSARVGRNRSVSAPGQPSPRRTFSFAPAVFVRVRGAMHRRSTRSRITEIQPVPQVQNESRTSFSSFPELVFQMIGRETSGALETSHDGDGQTPHVQVEGRKVWEEFNNHASVLEKDLQKFQEAVKELGSSLELTGAARNLRQSISLTSRLFEDNAKKLFPRAMASGKTGNVANGYNPRSYRSWNSPTSANRQIETRPIHVELKAMAASVRYLRLALKHFLEFGDMAEEDLSLLGFEGDLNYWSLCLKRYEGKFESREVQMYIHDLSRELGAQFDDTSHYLKKFIDGVPTARLSQKHTMSNLQNLATIATFFSAVTATTIQYSYTKNNRDIDRAVNVFWFSSLVFSIASALNSFLVLTWRRANYSSPLLRIPWWLWLWIRQCPTAFLLISVVTFLAGLGCFTISSSQAHFTSVIVIISEGISAFGLAALLVWLAYDKWSFDRRRHSQLPVFKFAKSFQNKAESILPTHHKHSPPSRVPPEKSPDETASNSGILPHPDEPTPTTIPLSPAQRKARARQRWNWLLQQVVFYLQVGRKERGQELLESRRMDKLDASLRKLAICHELEGHETDERINDIQFDHHGRALAICKNGLSMRFELDSAKVDQLPHHTGQARQVVWTSSAGYLVTRKSQSIHVWRPSGGPVPQPHIIRDNSCYILDLPDAEAPNPPKLLSLEGARQNKLAVIDVLGHQHMVHEFPDLRIKHVDIIPDGSRALLAAEISRAEGDHPIKASPGRKLIVFNLINCHIEQEVPLWHEVHHVTVSVNGRWAVVTYKESLPPQLWSLHHDPSGVRLALERQFCARSRISMNEFDPTQNVRFSGRAHFMGNDRYILCATMDGKIHIWRRDKAHSIHVHTGLTLDKDKPVQIACNRISNDEFTFATRSNNGMVRIWKAQGPPTMQVGSRKASNSDSANLPSATGIVASLGTLPESLQTGPDCGRPPVIDVDSSNVTHAAGSVTRRPEPSLQATCPGLAATESFSRPGLLIPHMLSESPQASPVES